MLYVAQRNKNPQILQSWEELSESNILELRELQTTWIQWYPGNHERGHQWEINFRDASVPKTL